MKLPKIAIRAPRWSIRGRIGLAFAAMAAITVAIGIFAAKGADRSSTLVRDTYDETVIATSYARAATADFANMRAGFAHEVMSPASRHDIAKQLSAAMQASFQGDLATAVEKSSADTKEIGDELRKAVAAWVDVSERIGLKPTSAGYDDLERHARKVEELLETFVTRVSDRGYAFREEAQAATKRDRELAAGGVAIALAISGLVALMLYLRISTPIGRAARFAREIASGQLDGQTPKPATDEIGDLIRAMVSMRTDVKGMMGEQVVLREQSQARVAEALDGSREGVVIVDAHGTIQICNRQALDFLDVSREELQAAPILDALVARMTRSADDRSALLLIGNNGPETRETLLPDGRWIQNSRNRTGEGGLVALYTDITAIRAQKDALVDLNATLDAALANMSQGLCLFDADNRLRLSNSRVRTMFGLGEGELRHGVAYADMVAWVLKQSEKPSKGLARAMRHENALIRRRRSLSRSVTIGKRIFDVTQEPMPDGGWIATYEDITERRRAEAQIAFLADHDALTRLPNRTKFARRVEEATVRARRGIGFALHCLDLDHFKQVNEMLGHAVGDQLLTMAVERLLACVRETDTVARLGSDEFAIFQADVSHVDQVIPLAQRVVDAMAEPYRIGGQDLLCGASVGIAMSPSDGLSHAELLKNADAALDKAKRDGRGTWRFFEAAMDEKLQARRALGSDLRQALARNEFELRYQPLLDVRTTRLRGFEALLRWRHPSLGLLSPDQFIPIAEETGLIKTIGAWVLRSACAEAINWPGGTRIAVNVSAIQLQDPGFVQVVSATLAETGLRPQQLELEITESVLMADRAAVLPILTTLRAAGVRFAMDDFGTGYSSLSTLRSFSFDKIKIDRSFVRDIGTDDAADQIVRTVLALGRSLGMRVTAEGVETDQQMQMLADIGCDEIQGYLIGKPMPAASIPALFARYAEAAAAAAAAAAEAEAEAALPLARKRRSRPEAAPAKVARA